MASALITKDHISCFLCSNIYQDPYALKCLHSFCQRCLPQISSKKLGHLGRRTSSTIIICPICQHTTDNNQVRKDLKTQGFVDLYNEQQVMLTSRTISRKQERQKYMMRGSDVGGKSLSECEMCGGSGKSIKSKCVDCRQLMCEDCAISHRGIADCQNHQVLPVKDVLREIQASLQTTVAQLETDKAGLADKSKQVRDDISFIESSHKKQLSEVNRQVDKMIASLESYRKRLNETVNVESYRTIDNLKKATQVFEANQYDIQGDIEFLTELIQNADLATVGDSATAIESSIKHDIKNLKENLPKVEAANVLPVTLEIGSESFDPQAYLKVNITNTEKQDLTEMVKALWVGKSRSASSSSYKKSMEELNRLVRGSEEPLPIHKQSELIQDTSIKKQHYSDDTVLQNAPSTQPLFNSSDFVTSTPRKDAKERPTRRKAKGLSKSLMNVNTTAEHRAQAELPVKIGQSTFINKSEEALIDTREHLKHNKTFPVLENRNEATPAKLPNNPYRKTAPSNDRSQNSKAKVKETKSFPLEDERERYREKRPPPEENYFTPSIDSVFLPQKYANVVNYTYKYEKNVALTFYPQRLCLSKRNIWIAGWDGVYVFNKQAELIKTIQHQKLQFVRGIAQAPNGDLIVACAGNKGLFRLDPSGKFKDRVAYGNYTDVCTYHNFIYALDNEKCKIIVFELRSKSYKTVKEFSDIKKVERICVSNDVIYVSSRDEHRLFMYNVRGKLLYAAGEPGSRKPGRLKHPLLCDVNNSGDSLVADCDNHRMQVRYQATGHWRVLNMPGDLRWPVDSLVDHKASTVYIIKHEPSMLLKFSRKHASLHDLLDGSHNY